MTTSPPPPPPPQSAAKKSNGSAASEPVVAVPAEANAKAVGFELVKHYYTTLSVKPESIYAMYGKLAFLQHHNPFQSGDLQQFDTAKGRDSIKDHYAKSSIFENCKIAIHSLDSQPSMNESVMVLCNGEIALNNESESDAGVTQSYKFVQSFFITPKKLDGVTYYDIINDILRFVPDVDNFQELAKKANVSSEEAATAAAAAAEEAVVVTETPAATDVAAVKPEETKKEEESSKPKEKEEKKEESTEEEEQVKEEFTTEEAKEVTPPATAATPAASAKPLSWADRLANKNNGTTTAPVAAAAASATSPATPAPLKKKKQSSSSSPSAPSSNTSTAPTSADSTTSSKKQTPSPVGGKLKKKIFNKKNEEVYPIYIKGIKIGLDTSEHIVTALEKEFGKVDSCRVINHVALVDFKRQAAQAKALKVGITSINNHDLKLEPRIEKEKKKDFKKN